MKKLFRLLLVALLVPALSLAQIKKTFEHESNEYKYEVVEGDPLNARIYTLDNGLKVYITQDKSEPRVQTYVAVRAGSKHDPADATGLAHYLEHMLFKGTSSFGTQNWEGESALLKRVSDLYEKHRSTVDEAERKAIYREIDSLSFLAAQYAIPNEYDKMISAIGATGTNAYTWVEQTVYINNIPSNELEKWAKIESERFQELVLRLFHTELETVYEEFNRGQDSDFRKAWKALFEGLFQNHPYGTQTTIGTGEHLKNPSMEKIHAYFKTYYVPNNMAIALSGDVDPDKAIEMIDDYFGNWTPEDLPDFGYKPEKPITEPIETTVYGSDAEFVTLGYRFDKGAGTRDALLLELTNKILMNGQAGLIDINLLQKQKVLNAAASALPLEDYSVQYLMGYPREGQSLDEVKGLLLTQIEKVKKGEFEDWMLKAAVRNMKLEQMKEYEDNSDKAHAFVDAFILDIPWAEYISRIEKIEQFTKNDIVEFANRHYKNNYVAVYKRTGKDTTLHKVEKPRITPLELNRDTLSPFHKEYLAVPSTDLEPVFVDYNRDIKKAEVRDDIPFFYIENTTNDLFKLYYILDMGSRHDKKLALAVKYLPYLGTDKYTPQQLQEEFYKLGLKYDVFASEDKVYVSLQGLNESFEEGVKLFEHVINNANPDDQALKDLVEGVLKEREDRKKNKGYILFNAMTHYAEFGSENPFTDNLSEEELRALTSEELVEKINTLTDYEHRIFYYGPRPQNEALTVLKAQHQTPEDLRDYPEEKEYEHLDFDENKVYFVHYDMVQAEFMLVTKIEEEFEDDVVPYTYIYNDFFGRGLSSIVFQEIREAKALAYSAFSMMRTPAKEDDPHYVWAYVGTQSDKLSEALPAMTGLMNNIPRAEQQFEVAKEAVKKKIATNRITRDDIYWDYEKAKKLDLEEDLRKKVYEKMQNMTIEDFFEFHKEKLKDKNYTLLVIGNRENMNMDELRKFGEVKELTLEEIFGY